MKKKFIIAGILLLSLVLAGTGLISADFKVGKLVNISEGYAIFDEYGPGGLLDGLINLSLDDEPFDSLLTASFDDGDYTDDIKIRDFLDNNGVNYSCSTSMCGTTFIASGSEDSARTLSLISGESKLLGIKISGGKFSSVSDFSIKFSSNSPVSCSNPLRIDVLNDGSNEWSAHGKVSGQFCNAVNNGYGCYNSAQKQNNAFITSVEYCNKITVNSAPNILIGANFAGNSVNADFVLSISNDDYNEECDVSVSGSGEKGCTVDISVSESQEFDVCIHAKDSEDENKYTIGMESISPCGYVGEELNDFAIFARPGKYSQIEDFELTTEALQSFNPSLGENTDLESYISNFIESEYNRDCSQSCIVPVKITSGAAQTVGISDISLFYTMTNGISAKADKIYDISETASLISMEPTVLDISSANLLVPSKYGNYNLMLKLNSQDLLEDELEITILKAPVIELVYPQKVPSSINVLFKAYTSGSNVSKYKWDFGDNSSVQETKQNSIVHKYSKEGVYTLTLSAENPLGITVKTFKIEVVSPSDYTPDILKKSQQDIEKIRTQINSMPAWLKSYFDSSLNLNLMESKLNELKTRYESSEGSTSENEEIITEIESLDIPSSLELTDTSSVQFLIDANIVNLNELGLLGAGSVSGSEQSYKDAIFEWSRKSMTTLLEKSVYSIYIDGKAQPIASKLKLVFSPKSGNANNIYLVVNNPNAVFKDSLDIKDVGQSKGVVLQSIEGTRELELLIPVDVQLLESPVYFSPVFSELSQYIVKEIDICNNNRVCNSEKGEDWKNCRADCKPWGWILFWIFLLLFIAFCIYIALQEWYKRKYESFLFKDKNDLYNLINFMDNAEKQKLSKEQIFSKLKEKKWKNEQIVYAWKKYRGERTGMWEIPVFKIFEKMQVKKELDKRHKAGISGKITPIPHEKPMNSINSTNMNKQNINKSPSYLITKKK